MYVREEFMQETQHTQQTATRKAQNQDKKTCCHFIYMYVGKLVVRKIVLVGVLSALLSTCF